MSNRRAKGLDKSRARSASEKAAAQTEGQDRKLPPVEESVGFLLRDTSRVFVDALHSGLKRRGLNIAHWQYLRVLWQGDGITQRELSKGARRMGASTTSALDNMERIGLVRRVRSSNDRREVLVFLTDAARALEPKIAACWEDVHSVATQGVRGEDIETIKKLLRQIRANLEAT